MVKSLNRVCGNGLEPRVGNPIQRKDGIETRQGGYPKSSHQGIPMEAADVNQERFDADESLNAKPTEIPRKG
jgi:hypothetical protein